MNVYKLRRKSDGFYYNKTNGWVDNSDMGEPYRTKSFASNAAKRLVKMFALNRVSSSNVEIVEYELKEINTYTI